MKTFFSSSLFLLLSTAATLLLSCSSSVFVAGGDPTILDEEGEDLLTSLFGATNVVAPLDLAVPDQETPVGVPVFGGHRRLDQCSGLLSQAVCANAGCFWRASSASTSLHLLDAGVPCRYRCEDLIWEIVSLDGNLNPIQTFVYNDCTSTSENLARCELVAGACVLRSASPTAVPSSPPSVTPTGRPCSTITNRSFCNNRTQRRCTFSSGRCRARPVRSPTGKKNKDKN